MSSAEELAQETSSENEDDLTPSQNKKRSLETQKSTEYFYSLLRVAETKEKILEAFQHFYSENSYQCNLMINKARKYFKLNARTSRSRRKNLADPEIAELFMRIRNLEDSNMPSFLSFMQGDGQKKKKARLVVPECRENLSSSNDSNNVALMATTATTDEIRLLLQQLHGKLPRNKRIEIMDGGAKEYREDLWNTIRQKTNELAATTCNPHGSTYSVLAEIDPRSLSPRLFLILSLTLTLSVSVSSLEMEFSSSGKVFSKIQMSINNVTLG
jgi:hypothetical protein